MDQGEEVEDEGAKHITQAVAQGDLHLTRNFLYTGGDVNSIEEDSKNTLLHLAIIHCNYNIAVLLLNNNADVSLCNSSGLSALQLAQQMPERQGFALAVQLSIRKRQEKEARCEKERLLQQHLRTTDQPLNRMTRNSTKRMSGLLEITKLNLENARSLVNSLESETRNAQKLVKNLEHQFSVIECQLKADLVNSTDNQNNIHHQTFNPESVRCTVCWEIPQPHVLQCIQGHILCDCCFSRPELVTCPECMAPLDVRIRNRVVESMLLSVQPRLD